jgi:hypothetical protein
LSAKNVAEISSEVTIWPDIGAKKMHARREKENNAKKANELNEMYNCSYY